MWRVLSGRKAKRNDSAQGERTNQGPSRTAMEPLTMVLAPRSDMDLRSQTDGGRSHVVQHQQVFIQVPPTELLSQADAQQQHESDSDHGENVAGPMRVSAEPATVNIEDLENDDMVIAVMGPTGSGKSTFIRLASGSDDAGGVGHTLKSFTSHVLAIRFWDRGSGRHIVLVDTPGFDDTFKSDLDILNMISDWLSLSYRKQKLLSGILYLHRITDNRMAGTPLKNLRVFRKLCGQDALDKVYLTTTMWDEVEQTVGEKRLAELRQEYWKVMITQGAQVVCCRNDDDSPKKIVQQVLEQEVARKAVLIQEEIADLRKELKETQAGQELYSQLEKLVERQLVLLRRIDEERKSTSDTKILEELRAEYGDLRAQIDDRLRQMQELKLSRLKNLLRLFSRKRD